jgi:hypothetical protein
VQLIIAKFGDIILFRDFWASWNVSQRSNSELVAFKNSPGIGIAVMVNDGHEWFETNSSFCNFSLK